MTLAIKSAPRLPTAAPVLLASALLALVPALALAFAVPARAADPICTPIADYAGRLARQPGAGATGRDGCVMLDQPRLVAWICRGVPESPYTVELMVKRSGEPVKIAASSVVEWIGEETGYDNQGLAYLRSGLVFAGAGEAVSVLFTDFLRDDPAVSSGRQTPEDAVRIARGAASGLACDTLKGPSAAARIAETVGRLHAASAAKAGSK